MLQVKRDTGFNRALPVERAFEVNEPQFSEAQSTANRTPPILPTVTASVTAPSFVPPSGSRRVHRRSEGENARRTFVQQIRRADDGNDFEFVVSEAGVVDTLAYDEIIYTTADDDATTQKDADRCGLSARYEIPDDGRHMSRMASKILGDRKEVEMHEFNARLKTLRADDDPLRTNVGDASNPVVDPSHERASPDI